MLKSFETFNLKGMFCYGLKCIVNLIDYYGYDFDDWHEMLMYMSDLTIINYVITPNGSTGRICANITDWDNKNFYDPAEILQPIIISCQGNKNFYPCESCEKSRWLFADYGAEDGFCLNFKDCEYVKNHYRYSRPDKNQYSEGIYRKCYDLYMRTDINLLRVIQDTFSIRYAIADEYFGGDRMPLIRDIWSVFDSLNIPVPTCDDLPDKCFGQWDRNNCFDSFNSIQIWKKS